MIKKIRQKFKYAYFLNLFMPSNGVCYYGHFDTKYVHIIQKAKGHKSNDKFVEIIPLGVKMPFPSLRPQSKVLSTRLVSRRWLKWFLALIVYNFALIHKLARFLKSKDNRTFYTSLYTALDH